MKSIASFLYFEILCFLLFTIHLKGEAKTCWRVFHILKYLGWLKRCCLQSKNEILVLNWFLPQGSNLFSYKKLPSPQSSVLTTTQMLISEKLISRDVLLEESCVYSISPPPTPGLFSWPLLPIPPHQMLLNKWMHFSQNQ